MNTIFPAIAPQRQVERLYELNIGRNWGLDRAEFDYVERHIPPWPDGELVVVTLVPYLRGTSARVGSVKRTFLELLNLAGKEQRKKTVWDEFENPGSEILRAAEHEPGLRWEIIDLGANQGRSLADVRTDHPFLPHAGILASAVLHPDWIRHMNGLDVPFTIIGGYEVKPVYEWSHAPAMSFGDETIDVDVVVEDEADAFWSVPCFLRAA